MMNHIMFEIFESKVSNTPKKIDYESAFAPSDKTDAVLVVEGKKLHVNKALLSYYSDYFKTLFNSDFAEKSMPEIPIKDVKFEDFAALLGLFQDNPITPPEGNAEKLLKLAERFLLPAAKRHLELYIVSTGLSEFTKLKIADKYNLDILLNHALNLYKDKQSLQYHTSYFTSFSDKTKARLFDRLNQLR